MLIFFNKHLDFLMPIKVIKEFLKQSFNKYRLIFAFLLLFIIPLFTSLVIQQQKPKFEQQIFDNLSAIADLKSHQISHWLDEQKKVANLIATNKVLQKQTQLLLTQQHNDSRSVLKELLATFQSLYQYEEISLISASGDTLINLGASQFSSVEDSLLITQSLALQTIMQSDITIDEKHHAHLNVVIPIVNQTTHSVMAVVLIHVNPEQFIFPYIQYWPGFSETGETLLVRRRGESVDFLNPLRHSTAQEFLVGVSKPMKDLSLPAAVALTKKQQGTVIGLDYRGVEVYAAYMPVLNTDWMLISKMDAVEATAAFSSLVFLLSLVSFFAVLVVLLVLIILIKKHFQALALQQQVKNTQIEYSINNFYELPFIGMAILEPKHQHWIRFNNRLAEMLKYSVDELSELNIRQIMTESDFTILNQQLLRLADDSCDGFSLESYLRPKDGPAIFVIINVKCVPNADGSVQFILITIQDVTDLKALGEQYSSNQSHLKTLIHTIPDLVWLKDLNGVYLSCNPMFERLYGAQEQDILGKTDYDFVDSETADFFRKHDLNAMQQDRSTENEEWLTFADDGYKGVFSTIKTPMRDDAGKVIGVLGVARDITVRKQTQVKLERLTKLYAALSDTNEAIVRSDNEQALFDSICKIAVLVGDFKLAWIGLIEQSSRIMKPVAFSGSNADYLQGLEISTDETSILGQGPSGIAARENHPYWCQDFQHDPHTQKWHVRGKKFGWKSSASLPIHCQGKVVGTLNLYSDALHAFDKPAKNLLLEMCNNISFALGGFAHKKEKLLAEIEREELYNRMFKLADRLPGMVYQYRLHPDGSSSFPFSSNAIKDIYRLTPEEVYADSAKVFKIIHPEDLDDVAASIQASAKNLTAWHKEYRVKFEDGTVRWLSGDAMPEKEKDGSILWHGFITDITEYKNKQAQIELASKVFEQSREGIMITDADQNVVMVNQAFIEISGYSAEEALGKNPKIFSSGRHSKQFYQKFWDDIDQLGFWQGEIWNRRKNGEVFPEWLSVSKGLNQLGQVSEYIAVFSDISKIKEDEEKIQRLAHYDPLTNLVNRQLLMDRLAHAISSAKRNKAPVSLLFIDLDHFKNVNDTLGHHVGDELLVEVGKRMSGLLRTEDTLARQGGDEFIVVLPGVGEAGAAHVAEKIVNDIAKRIQVESYELFVTPSIGVAVYPQDGDNGTALLKNADAAMYQAKDDGRNTYRFFTQEMQQRSSRLMLIENALRTALSRNELSLNYQPQICTLTGRVVGAEALIRWTHPELGIISPIEFISVAEQSGQILVLSQWVLRTALQYLKGLLDQGHAPFVMAVNLSAVDFQQVDLPEQVMKVVQETNVPPALLALELTESVAMANAEMAIEMMSKLIAKGMRIAIDDFGTGYSSLSYLKKLNASKVKIDQSFIKELTNNDEDKLLVKAIISLTHSLGLRVIAEGVETEEQLAFLKAEGCDEIQGYYFSKPLSADEFRHYLTRNN